MNRFLLTVTAGLLGLAFTSQETFAKGGHSGGHSGHSGGHSGHSGGHSGHTGHTGHIGHTGHTSRTGHTDGRSGSTRRSGRTDGRTGRTDGRIGRADGRTSRTDGRIGRADRGTGTRRQPTHSKGTVYRGRAFQHNVFSKGWHGWHHRRWFSRCNCWLYWAPGECCWYSYSSDDQVFLPCDDMTSEDISDDGGDNGDDNGGDNDP